MITIHHEKEADFTKNGYGAIDDYVINAEVNWEMNGQFSAYLEYPAFLDKADYLVNKNILRIPVPFTDDQLFRIYRTRKVLGFIQVEARHIFYDLIDNLIEDTNIVGKDGLQALQQLLGATQYEHPFTGLSNITATNNARIVRYNPVEALLDDTKANTFVSRWGGEIVRDNFIIRMAKQMGSDRGVHIQHKKDLLGYEATIDESTVVTRIMPIGFDGLKLPELYIDSPLIDLNNPKIKVIKYDDVKAATGKYVEDEDAIPVAEAYALLRKYAKEEFSVNHLDEPETTVRVNFASLHNTKEYDEFSKLQEIKQGDVVKVSVPEEGFEITSRLVAFTSDPLRLNHYTSTTLGNHVFEFTSSSNDTTRMRNEVEKLKESVVTALQSANGKNRNFWGTADPNTLSLNASVGDNYFRENGEETILYQYVELNGERYWKEILDTSKVSIVAGKVDEAIAEAEQAKEEAQSAYENALTDAKAEAERLDNERQTIIDGKFEEVNNANETLEQSIATAEQNAQDALTKAGASEDLAKTAKEVSESALANIGTVQTELGEVKNQASDSLLKAQEALDATGTLSTQVQSYEETVDGYKSEVANYSRTNETLTAKVKSYEETVDGYSQSLTRVEGKINNLEIGGRNILKDTEGPFIVTKPSGSSYYDAIIRATIVVPDGDEYILSFKAKASAPTVLRSHFHSPNTTTRVETSTGYTNISSDGAADTKITTEWASYWVKWNQSETTSLKSVIIARLRDSTTLEIKEIKLEKGNKATDWTPAPEDLVSQSEYSVYQNQVKSTTDEHTRRLTALDGDGGRISKVEQTASQIQTSLSDYAKTAYVDTQITAKAGQVEQLITEVKNNPTGTITGYNSLKNNVDSMVQAIGSDGGKIAQMVMTDSVFKTTVAKQSDVFKNYRVYAISYSNRNASWAKWSDSRIIKPDGSLAPTHANHPDRSYFLYVIDENGKEIYSKVFDVWTDVTQATALANAINSFTNRQYLIMLMGSHAPRENRTEGGLPQAIYRIGGSPEIFINEDWSGQPAYLLVGKPGLGQGRGYEYFVPDSQGGSFDITIPVLNGSTPLLDSSIQAVNSQVTQLSNSWALTLKSGNDIKTAINATTNGIRLKGNLITLDGLVNMTSGFVVPEGNIGNLSAKKITSGTIDSARIDAKTIVTNGLQANVIKSTHILADNALFEKLFTDDLATEKLATKEAWIKSSMIGDAQIGTAQIGKIDASNGRIINLDASSITSGTMTANRISGGALTSTNGSTSFDLNTGQLSFQQDGVAIKNQFSDRPLQYLAFKTGTYDGSRGSYTALMSNSGNSAAMDENSAGIQIWNNFDRKTAITLYGNVITFRRNADVNVTEQIDIDTVNRAIKHVNTINDLRIVPMSLSGTSGVALMYGNDAGMWIGGYGDFAFKHDGVWIGKARLIN